MNLWILPILVAAIIYLAVMWRLMNWLIDRASNAR